MTNVQVRTRRAAAQKAAATSFPPSEVEADVDADPDYLALSVRQRKAIDRAFQRGLKASNQRGQKRKRVSNGIYSTGVSSPINEDVEDAGGFIPDDDMGGGFIVDDEEAGGFLPDDDEGGGFIPEDDGDQAGPSSAGAAFNQDSGGPSTRPLNSRPKSAEAKTRLPLYLLPGLLSSLDLPSDDDVLNVFRASASGWGEEGESMGGSKRRRDAVQGEEEEGGVELKDFRAVCAALFGPDEDPNGAPEEDGEVEDDGAMSLDEDEDDEDAFHLDSDSTLSSLSGSSYGAGRKGKIKPPTTKSKDRAKGKGKARAVEEVKDNPPIKLSSAQKEMVRTLWGMVKPGAELPGRKHSILGRDEVKGLARSLGEMWTEDEVCLAETSLEARLIDLADHRNGHPLLNSA